MKPFEFRIKDALFTFGVLAISFLLSVCMGKIFDAHSLIPMIFVLGVFLISFKCQGYFWGITASLIGVLVVNYAFTFPYYEIDLISPTNYSCAVVMIVVAVMTGTLTTKLKNQEKIKAESDKERMRANLLRAVSHDLRTPLTSVYGACSTVVENYDTLSKEQHLRLLGDAKKDAEWLIRMVENLLSITRVDDSNIKLQMTPTVLEELVDTVVVKFKKRCPEVDIEVQIPETFVSVHMDAMLIEQVLINILENAVYHAKGMRRLVLNVVFKDDLAAFSIIDDGCGISPEQMENLFAGHLNSNTSADSRRSNMGIGLSVCDAIIKAHGGQLTAKNREEGGAVFTFSLKAEE